MSRNEHIVIRSAGPGDDQDLDVLAVIDGGRRRPEGRIVVAESNGRLRAAVGSNGAAISDPFYPSANLVSMLRVHADAFKPVRLHAPRFALRHAATA
jgi:hypothetical protein